MAASAFTTPSFLAQETRGDHLENQHHGWLVVSNPDGRIAFSTHLADNAETYFRSAAKPFQAFPLVRSGLFRQIPQEAIAIACSSHSGSQEHLRWVDWLLEACGKTEADLQCGPHTPLEPEAARELIRTGQAPDRRHHNCSGKHAGFLYYCHYHQLPTENYLSPEHPLQLEIRKSLQEFTQAAHPHDIAIDGCGAPVFYLPIKSMATVYAKLTTEPELQPILVAMTNHPALIGGHTGRIDTALMTASQGRLVTKVGADGVICAGNIEQKTGLALKIEDGSNSCRDWAIVQTLRQLEWLTEKELQHPLLSGFASPDIHNSQGKVVGQRRVNFL
jgi:L-asparaginase II